MIPGGFVETVARLPVGPARSPPKAGTIAADGGDRGRRATIARERFREVWLVANDRLRWARRPSASWAGRHPCGSRS